ncbi:MAG: 2-oxo acid dehydrogenase subunit E2 [Candidatus Omnitrophica bacterium]|nr:2-oxo acid dehydrogenase subunit E2 [Candidatus Omnitrophota bacterium]
MTNVAQQRIGMELKLPEIGENITQGTVTKVLVKVGDSLKKGQNILELETDKAVVEIPSNMDGTISEILVKAGSVVKIGQPVFILSGSTNKPLSPPNVSVGGPEISQPLDTRHKHSGMTENFEPTTPRAVGNTIQDLALPPLGENLEKGTVTKILVKEGDAIKKGQNILELETDKAVLEVPSPVQGVVKEILIKSGTVIKVGQPVFKILSGAVAAPVTNQPSSSPKALVGDLEVSKPLDTRQRPTEVPDMRGQHSGMTENTTTTTPAISAGPAPVRKDISAAPSVRMFAREIGIDIGQVLGSGPGGRISVDDVKKYSKALNTGRIPYPAAATTKSLPDFSKWGNFKREAMSNVRKKTAEHLSFAWNAIPHVTQFEKVDITEIEKLRKLSSTHKKLSITAYLIKIMAIGLQKFPQFNASVDMATNEIVFKDFINIGVAVDTDRGLLVPVLKNVDRLTVPQISDELVAVAERARTRKTGIEELQGGTFTISNLGGIGGSFFTPIVNWPEVAILGVSRGVMEPVYVDGMFLPKLMLPISLSYDHRLIDGADGARFIRWIASALENPSSVEGL